MTYNTKAYAAPSATERLGPFTLNRREAGPHDIQIEIVYCGVCHSDIHQVRNEWGNSIYPMVPGHEIVGRVTKVGDQVRKFNVRDLAGAGCFVDSCRECPNCAAGLEQYCRNGLIVTYNGYEKDGKTPTYGGYSTQIVVDEKYTLKVSPNLPTEGIAPLLCAGITTYSPLRHWKVGKGHKIGVVGLGGLGHMAVKFASSFGAEVTVLSTSDAKKADAKRLGAAHFINTKDEKQLKQAKGEFDFLLNTIAAHHDINSLVQLLKLNGTMIMVGIPPEDPSLSVSGLIGKRRTIAGSMIGGMRETQEMLDYCAEKNIICDVEVIAMKDINNDIFF